MPNGFVLHQNYPNPFNPNTRIAFTLAEPSVVSLEVYDMQGRCIEHLLPESAYTTGSHDTLFGATDLASGSYLYRLRITPTATPTQTFTATQTMKVVK